MIKKDHIEKKYFYDDFPHIISKICVVTENLHHFLFDDDDCPDDEVLQGLRDILWEGSRDLKLIYKALYPEVERDNSIKIWFPCEASPEPDTAPISTEEG